MSNASATEHVSPVAHDESLNEETRATKIFVGNLPLEDTLEHLKALFDSMNNEIQSYDAPSRKKNGERRKKKPFGEKKQQGETGPSEKEQSEKEQSEKVPNEKERSEKVSGFGFVTMKNLGAAERAIETFHNHEFLGQRVVVQLARKKEPKEPIAQKARKVEENPDNSAVKPKKKRNNYRRKYQAARVNEEQGTGTTTATATGTTPRSNRKPRKVNLKPLSKTAVFISKLPSNVTAVQLANHFKELLDISVNPNIIFEGEDKTKIRGAIVEVGEENQAKVIKCLPEQKFMECTMSVKAARLENPENIPNSAAGA